MPLEIWYMKPSFFRDGIGGMRWLKKQNLVPDVANLNKTHTLLRILAATDLKQAWMTQQAECWSPNGEMRDFIESKELEHTSMSVGDIAVDRDTEEVFMVDSVGFVSLGHRFAVKS